MPGRFAATQPKATFAAEKRTSSPRRRADPLAAPDQRAGSGDALRRGCTSRPALKECCARRDASPGAKAAGRSPRRPARPRQARVGSRRCPRRGGARLSSDGAARSSVATCARHVITGASEIGPARKRCWRSSSAGLGADRRGDGRHNDTTSRGGTSANATAPVIAAIGDRRGTQGQGQDASPPRQVTGCPRPSRAALRVHRGAPRRSAETSRSAARCLMEGQSDDVFIRAAVAPRTRRKGAVFGRVRRATQVVESMSTPRRLVGSSGTGRTTSAGANRMGSGPDRGASGWEGLREKEELMARMAGRNPGLSRL